MKNIDKIISDTLKAITGNNYNIKMEVCIYADTK